MKFKKFGWDILHPKQKKLYELLSENEADPLTLRDLAYKLNVGSHNTVMHHMKQLEKKGYIIRKNDGRVEVLDSPISDIIMLNLYGTAKCGPEGFINDDNVIDRVPLPAKFFKINSESYLIKASNDSMEPLVYDNDLVLVKQSNDCDSGDVAVVVHNDGAKIKKVIKKDKGKQIVLFSLNNKYEPVFVNFDKDRFEVVGIVKDVIHRNI